MPYKSGQNRPESTQTVFEEDSPSWRFSRQSRQLRSPNRSVHGLGSQPEVNEVSPVSSTVSSQWRRRDLRPPPLRIPQQYERHPPLRILLNQIDPAGARPEEFSAPSRSTPKKPTSGEVTPILLDALDAIPEDAQHSSANSTLSGQPSIASTPNRDFPKTDRYSTASATSIDTNESDDPTPPEDATKKLSPVEESPLSAESPIHGLRYPRVPRASNQAVARSPRSPKGQTEGVTGSPTSWGRPSPKHEPDFQIVNPGTSRTPPITLEIRQESSPPYHHRAGTLGSPYRTPPRNADASNKTQKPQQAASGRRSSRSEPEQQWAAPSGRSPAGPARPSPRTPPGMAGFPTTPMPKLTPTRRGDELYLSVT
ncbi:hypothetical protein P152DRAFT_456019 [Eremomyces bilateralis CBS 781.70]|uniref:Uncharacterized protein n=1 Tax=Eremomyces bilateralis CBS 781.70 TaxID=1392243 RepID=A0A6G1GAP7_9PEZI|nr:uncharacterized protein P152DRAFT_456019 [Eremomyces bilateralis CBS 781.70]KAF1814981.1 hypothetical protein P152DRAFT_456019 [Eremomyces bilateralis CBS 781.70]